MPDSLALSVAAIVAVGLVALALVWPQGQGARSPAPFGHPLAAIEQPAAPPSKPEALRRALKAVPVHLRAKPHVAPAATLAPR
jgi:hypothetical protein